MDILLALQDKIDQIHYKERKIKKIFKFNSIDLKDKPQSCFSEILDYLTKNKDKIKDFDLEYWIDPDDFSNVICLNILPSDEISNNFSPLYPIFGITSREAILNSIRESIQNILSEYSWDFNSKKNRDEIRQKISKILRVKIEDKTRKEQRSSNVTYFKAITEKGEEYTLDSYIEKISKNGKKSNVGDN